MTASSLTDIIIVEKLYKSIVHSAM